MTYRTMQGREIDLEKLMRQQELSPAIGNMKVNARGDELGPGGKIIRKREEIVGEYYEHVPKNPPNRAAANPVAETSQAKPLKQETPTINTKKNQPEV